MADTSFTEIKDAIEGQNRAFEEFKHANDLRLKELEKKDVADPLLQEKLDKINKDLDQMSALTDSFAELEMRMNQAETFGGPVVRGDQLSDEEKADLLYEHIKSDAIASGMTPKINGVDVKQYRGYIDAFERYVRKGANAIGGDEYKALTVGGDPEGGYTVPPDMTGRMVRRLFETSPIRGIASVQSINSDRLEGLVDNDDATLGGWVGEVGARTETATPTFDKYEIPVHEQFANPAASQRILDDSAINIESWLGGKIADKLSRAENTAFVTGDGSAKPRGFASYTTAATADGSRAWGVLEHVLTGTSGGFGTAPNGSDKLLVLLGQFKDHFLNNFRWAMKRATLASVRQLVDGAGAYIWLPSMTATEPSSLLGYPVSRFEDMAAIGADSLSIAGGDFTGYQIVDRIGVRTLRDPYTNKPYVHFYTTKRVGGDVIDFEAIKFLKFGA